MQNLTPYIASDGTKYHIPADKEAEFKADFGEDAQPAVRYRTKDGQGYTIPTSEIENFRVDFPDAEPTRRMSFADGSTRDFTVPELSKFLRSPEWRDGEQYKADREERDRIVASRPVPNPKSESTFLADYADGLADSGGTAIGRTLGGSLSRFAKFIGTVTELDPRTMAKDYARKAVKGTFSKDDFTAGAVADRMLNNGGMFIGNQIDKATDILFPAEQKTDSAVAQGVGKAIGLGAGLAEFALTPTPILAGGHFVEGWQQTYEAAKARGATDEEAMQLGLMRGGTDAGITTAFKNAPVHRIMKAFGYAPKGAVQALIDKAGKDGIAGVARGDLATAVGKQMLANAIPSIIEMGGLGAAQEFIDSAIKQEAQTGKIDWEKCATDALKTGGEQALFGAVMAMLPTPFKVREALKQRDAMLKTALEEPMGVLAYANANPEAANKLAEAWSREGKISRRVAREAGLPEMDEASRNAVGETIVKSQDANAELAKNRIAAEKTEAAKQPTEIKPNETRNGADEAPAQPKPPVETRAEGAEAVRPVEAEPPRGEAPRPDVVKPAEKPKEPPQGSQEPPAPPKTGEDTPRPAEGVEAASRASDAKLVPDGKGKMVKPKAAESDYGVTMFEEHAVDGDGVSYVVKDGPSDAHRMMFKSKAEAEARLAKLRAERKAIKESPSATLADGAKVYLRKTNEGWVPYNENYIDLRRGLFKAAKTKAEAIKVAEKGVKRAKDVADFNSAFKRFEEDFGLDDFNEKVGSGGENGEGLNESAALEHLRRFDLKTLEDLKERAKQFNLGHHNGRDKKIQTWFDQVISEKKAPVPDGKGKMVKPAPTEPPKTTAPVVDETGKTAEVTPPDSVEAKISAMKRGSPEQLKAQKEYFETEIAKAEEAIKGKLDEPTKKKVGSKWVNEWKPKKDAGEVPPSVTIKIPGDGEFTVPNNPDGIARLKMVAAKFKAAPKKGKVETDSIPREPSLKPAEKPKIESAEKETALFVSDGKREPLRKSVSKPFSDGEYVYATDGRMIVRRPLRKGEKVNGEIDAPIDATHKVIKEATANRENDTKLKASVSELYPKLIQAGVIADLRPDYLKKGAIQLWRGSDGKLQIRTRDDAGNEYFTDGLSKSSKPLAQIQGEYLQNFLKLVAKSGGGEIEISVKDAESPLLLKGGGWDAALMPLRTGDSPKSSPASKAKKPTSDVQPQKPLADVRGKNAEQAEFELPKQPPIPQNAARNPKALKDPNFVKWAKKHGRTPTPFARREYDRQKIEAAVPLYQRIFPGMKIKIHDKVEDPAKWTKDHPDGTLKLIRAKSGEVLGWYTPGFKELHLNPGATVETVAHEMLHAAQDWAKANSPELARALDNIARDCPRALKQRILRTYGAISPEAIMKEWGAFNFMGGEMGGKGKGGKAILDEIARRENMTWAGKFWTAVKDIWKSMAAKMGGNRIDLSAIDSKTPQEAMDFLARAFAEGKTLGKMPKVGKTPRPAIDMTRKLTAKEKWEVNLHNYRDPLKVLLDDMVERGAKFDDSNNFYEASRLQKGFDQAAVNDANRRMAEYTKMCKEKGVTHDEVVEFMQAQAAKDRNAMILQRNGKLDGSAMSDKVAANTLRAFEDAGKGDALREISDYLLAMQAEGLQYRVQTGLLSAEAAAEMTKREPKHVPFRSAIDPETGDYIEWGNDHNSFAKAEFQRAEGRQTLAGDVVSWMFDEFIDAHTRGNENTVRKMIADAMRLHPEMGVGKILKGARKTTAHDFQGVVSKVVNNGNKGLLGKKAKVAIVDDPNYRESRRNGDGGRTNVLAFKEGGEAHFIEFAPGERGSRIQAAVNGRDLKSMGKLWQKGMRFWSSTATELSPTFAVRNVIADNIDVFGNYVGEYGAIKGHAAYAKHVKNAAQLTPALMKYIATGKLPQGEMGEWIKRYEKAGGQIAGFANEGYNDIVKKIDLAPKHGIEKGKAIAGAVKDAVLSPVKGINAFAELSTRVAAFKTQCEMGMTDHKAALWSRESTVDFNMRGNWTGISNGLYMFSNSTLGASARQLKSLFSSKHGWEVAGTFFAYGFAEGALECLMNGDESEREKRGEGTGKDVNEYTRANSVYVRNGDKVYRVPFHAGPFSFIKYIGNCAARNAFGKMKLEDAGKEIGKEAVSQIFHYTGMGSVNFQSQSGKFADDVKTFIGTAVPSIGQNIVQGAFNIDHAGRSIYNEGFPGSTTPRSEQGRPSTPNWASDAAKWLNEKTGGNDARSGYVDLPPEVIKLAGEAVGKNLLRDVMNVGTVIGMALGDEKVDVRNIPVARDFVRPVSGNDRRFNDALKEYNADTDEYSKKKSTWTREERIAYKKSHPWVDDKTKDTIDEIKKLHKREQGFWYKNGKAKPHEWTQEDLEKFKAKRQKLQALVLEKMRK